MEAVYNEMGVTSHKKVWGDHSLTVGEIVCWLLAVAIVLYGTKVKIPAGMKVWVALAVAGIGQALF